MKNKEELIGKYGNRFKNLNELAFTVDFPNGDKSTLRLMRPKQYKAFMQAFEGVFGSFRDIGLSDFEILNDKGEVVESFKGENITPPAKPVWERNEDNSIKKNEAGEKIQERDEEDKPVFAEITKIRVKVAEEDNREYPKNLIRIVPPKEAAILEMLESIVWDNAANMLQIFFPEDRKRFSREYVDEHLNVPFLLALLELAIDMNGLDFIVPFIGELFPALKVLFGDKAKKK